MECNVKKETVLKKLDTKIIGNVVKFLGQNEDNVVCLYYRDKVNLRPQLTISIKEFSKTSILLKTKDSKHFVEIKNLHVINDLEMEEFIQKMEQLLSKNEKKKLSKIIFRFESKPTIKKAIALLRFLRWSVLIMQIDSNGMINPSVYRANIFSKKEYDSYSKMIDSFILKDRLVSTEKKLEKLNKEIAEINKQLDSCLNKREEIVHEIEIIKNNLHV